MPHGINFPTPKGSLAWSHKRTKSPSLNFLGQTELSYWTLTWCLLTSRATKASRRCSSSYSKWTKCSSNAKVSGKISIASFREGKSQILLWRKLPMAWGVPQQIEKPHKSISFQYGREIQHLTLKDLNTYLISDGCSRPPLSFSNPVCVNNFLSQKSTNKKSMLCNCVIPTLEYIINNV